MSTTSKNESMLLKCISGLWPSAISGCAEVEVCLPSLSSTSICSQVRGLPNNT